MVGPSWTTARAGPSWNPELLGIVGVRFFSGSTRHFLALGGPGIALERIVQEREVQLLG